MIALALLAASVAAAFLVAYKYHLGVPQTLVAVLVGGGAPAGLYLAWAAYRDDRRDDSGRDGLTLVEVADQLAAAVGAQWEAEASVRRLNDPYPLPIFWSAADASLVDGWDVLATLATSGAGWPSRPPGTWADGPDGLAGSAGDLADVLKRVPTGRLVVLGEPGSGKTTLMVRLVLDLLKDRASGDPVPVLASPASWNPKKQDLHGWLATQLTINHPGLAAPAPASTGAGTRFQALLAARLILPILDGLDEIPDALRGPAISQINDALRPGERLVVTCRTGQYRDAVRPSVGREVTLRAAAAVQLCQLNAGDVSRYLREDAGGPVAAAHWDPVLAVLGTPAPAGQALVTPLMVSLARTIYNPRPGEQPGEQRDPAELCDPALTDRASVEWRLFDAFIPAAYRPGTARRWTAEQAGPWLAFLARHLEHTIDSPDLAWWQLIRAGPRWANILVAPGTVRPSRGLRFSLREVARSLADTFTDVTTIMLVIMLVITIVIVLVIGLVIGRAGTFAGAIGGLAVLLLLPALWPTLAGGFAGVPDDLAVVASPRAVLATDRRAALILWFAAGIGMGIGLGFISFLAVWVAAGLAAGIAAGIAVCVAAGLAFGLFPCMTETAWPSYRLACVWLAMRHRLPWRLIGFLDDAHQRGVLRQVGAVYQFRHIELQHWLAT